MFFLKQLESWFSVDLLELKEVNQESKRMETEHIRNLWTILCIRKKNGNKLAFLNVPSIHYQG